MRPVLEARGLEKSFGSLRAVAGIDLSLARGECLALLGPNGAGKTTTVEMLEGLTAPDRGTVELLGHLLPGARRAAMQRVGVLLQETNLYKRYTVRETLELFGSFYEKSVAPAELLAKLALTDKADAQLRTLSGGQKQRAYIACALVNDPEVLFLDEPTTGLDPQARRAIWDLLDAVKGEGRSILLTTHYMEEAAQLADRVAIVDHGRVIAEGTPRSLVRDHIGEQILWVQLGDQAAAARLTTKLPWLAEASPMDGGLAVATGDMVASTRALLETARAEGVTVKALQTREGTLEDVFLKLTGRSMRDV